MAESLEDKVTVLLVDDDPNLSWHLGRYLTRRGFVVTTCVDGAEAIRLLERSTFASLITDIQMPELNGLALIEWVRQNRPNMPVLVITAFGSPSIRQVVMSKGALHYLEKPVDPDLLARLLYEGCQPNGFSGSVAGIDLFDYLQLVLLARKRLVLEVNSQIGNRGKIYIDNGYVKHAECEGACGQEAFFRCLLFEGGSFSSLPWSAPGRVTIDQPGEFLLLDAARMRDESARHFAQSDRSKASAPGGSLSMPGEPTDRGSGASAD